jgi:hypothetical protein
MPYHYFLAGQLSIAYFDQCIIIFSFTQCGAVYVSAEETDGRENFWMKSCLGLGDQ